MTNRIALVIAILTAIGIVVFLISRPGNDDGPRQETDITELAELQSRSLALLENQIPRDALKTLNDMKAKFPKAEDFANYNLCLAHLYVLELENAAADNAKFASELTAANQHFKSVEQYFAKNVDFLILKSRLSRVQNSQAVQIQFLKDATELSPESPELWYQLLQVMKTVQAMKTDEVYVAPEDLQEAIEKCLELAPNNVWVALQVLGTPLSGDTSPLRTALQNLKESVAPFAAGVEVRSRVNPITFIDQALTQLENDDSKGAQRTIRILNNILIPEDIAQSDRRIVERDTLEYVKWDLPDELQTAINALRNQVPPAIDVKFKPTFIETDIEFSEIQQCEVADIDLDGDYEILVLEPQKFVILEKQESEDRWEAAYQIDSDKPSISFVLADIDQDADVKRPATIKGAPCALADLDIIVLHDSGLSIIQNGLGNLAGTDHQDTTESVFKTIDPQTFPSNEFSPRICLPVDFDLDGDLDLCIVDDEGAIRLWANYANFKFSDVTDRSELPEDGTTWSKAVAVDIDRDADIDIVLAGQNGVGYLENLRHGSLRWRLIADKADGLTDLTDVAIADINLDASWDLVACDGDAPVMLLSKISETGTTRWEKPERLQLKNADQIHFWDYDNDGFEDLTVFSKMGTKNSLARRTSATEFSETTLLGSPENSEPERLSAQVGIAEDIDGDGDLDWFSWNQTQLALHTNEGGNKNGYLRIGLVGAQIKGGDASASGRVNHYGWGSLCELKAGTNYQAKIVDRPVTHFGLGTKTTADLVRVLWPNGIPHNVIHPEKNSYICENQRLKGSCPYLYLWNGDEFRFYTDLCWAGPIGLQFADGVIAPTRPWEYLLISGDSMKSKDGQYELRVTEELWEAAYFDQIELIAIDHPDETQIFSNEKVASSETPEFKIHTVANPRQPVQAVDKNGRDVLPEIAKQDDVYTKLFDTKHFQGVTEQHFLELDLGEVPENDIKLFMTGWVYPTDTSMNVALGQSPEFPKPQPPFLQVIDDSSNWKTVIPSMGFPGGKTKTIVIDLAGKFLTADRKLRIVTSMEIYWDHIFFTAGDNPVDLRQQTLELEEAELHWRGFSQFQLHPANGPESYDYHNLIDKYDWPPMKGPFTSYGDVAELIRTEDDKMVVMGAGDEMIVRFKLPAEPVPNGWKRDFIMHNVGYDKDADLNTIYGQTTEPYPTKTTATYPANREREQTATHREESYRQQPTRRFWNLVRDSQPTEEDE